MLADARTGMSNHQSNVTAIIDGVLDFCETILNVFVES